MSGLGRVVVGYRNAGPGKAKISLLYTQHGQRAIATTKCIGDCGHIVYFVPSGYDAARYRDAQVICEDCYAVHRDQIKVEL